ATAEFRALNFDLIKNGAPTGNMFLSIRTDNAGEPGDVLAESGGIYIPDLTTGSQVVELPRTVLAAGTYWLVMRTDEDYKSSFVTTTTAIELEGEADPGTTDSSISDGATWASSDMNLTYALEGITLDLRVKITSSVADLEII